LLILGRIYKMHVLSYLFRYCRHFFDYPPPEQEVTVLVPEEIDVEVLKAWGNLQLHLPAVKSNWEGSFG
jgi:hypothetical protein